MKETAGMVIGRSSSPSHYEPDEFKKIIDTSLSR